MKFVSVIIPVFNDSERLKQCLQRLYVQSYPYSEYEVIVVDNNSTEKIYSVCQQFPNVQYIQESKQGSYAARNRGLAIAKGEIIAFTDSDCLPQISWIQEGVKALSSSDAAIVAGHIEFYFSKAKPSIAEYVDSVTHLKQQRYATEGFAATANLFTWARIFNRVGGFAEVESLGDRQWGKRVSESGYTIIYSPDTVVWHPARSGSSLLQKIRLQARHKAFSVKDILNHLCPCGVKFWRSVWGDRNLPHLTDKLQFAALIHFIRWINVYEGVKAL
jgi:glycosyltransferase involved in cell wall biosynthesis